MGAHSLDRLLAPRGVAVFGASDRPGAVGTLVLANLLAGGFDAAGIHAVNPRRKRVADRPCHASLATVPGPIDLAVIVTPADAVAGVLGQCGEHGVRSAAVISTGFGEPSARERLRHAASAAGVRLLGPNCLGLARPHAGLNATFSRARARPGPLALVSQSGALCTAILDWAERYHVGFSAIVSLGDAADVDFGDLLDALALDTPTRAILLYVEGVRRPRRFMSGLRAAARLKPVVVVKSGRSAGGARAAVSHAGALVGADDVFDAALRRAGVVRVSTIEQLFAAAQMLATHHRVRGNRLAIATNAGGPGVLAADRAAEFGVELSALAPATLRRLDADLPAHWSRDNPVDIRGDATPDHYGAAVRACLDDDAVDGVLVMLAPQAMSDPTGAARTVVAAARGATKPVLTCWMGEGQVEAARAHFAEQHVPTFGSPETAVEAFAYLARFLANQRLLLQVPGPLGRRSHPDVDGARRIIEEALREDRTTLGTTGSKAVLAAFGVPVAPATPAATPAAAVDAADALGFPVALKIDSPDITHKGDVDGIRLDVRTAADVRNAFRDLLARVSERVPGARLRGVTVERMVRREHGRELIVGVSRDAVFGPVLAFGAGGAAVEILRDRAVALPPLNRLLARELIGRTRVARLLATFRQHPAADLDAIEQVLLRVSELVCELPHVVELDINPLTADEAGAIALDARIVVAEPDRSSERYAHMAIHPYPTGLETRFRLPGGADMTIRPIRPEDAEIEASFVRNLSPRARYFRFMHSLNELTPEMLVRFTQIDYDREMAFIAIADEGGAEAEVGVARYVTNPDERTCEFAVVVADAWQGRGIGSRLMTCLIESARARGLERIEGEVLRENAGMLKMMERLGFTRGPSEDETVAVVVRRL